MNGSVRLSTGRTVKFVVVGDDIGFASESKSDNPPTPAELAECDVKVNDILSAFGLEIRSTTKSPVFTPYKNNARN